VEAVLDCGAIAILIGPNGVGPWELEESRVALNAAVQLKKRLIPVLLPGAVGTVSLPLEFSFLNHRTRVDFSKGFVEDELMKLVKGSIG
jgi:hypothetical protein